MNMTSYFRPIVRTGSPRSKNSIFLAETNYWVSEAEEIKFGKKTKLVSVNDVPDWWKKRWLKKRSDILGMEFGFPKLMGILNVTPDSFSDGGDFIKHSKSILHAKYMHDNGANYIDVGGESTRPGARRVSPSDEILRVMPSLQALRSLKIPTSLDTRNSSTMEFGALSGVEIINDVSGLENDRFSIDILKKYKKNLIIITPAFVTDCLETLEEIAMEGKEEFIEAGGESFHYVPCLNDSDQWSEVICSWVKSRI